MNALRLSLVMMCAALMGGCSRLSGDIHTFDSSAIGYRSDYAFITDSFGPQNDLVAHIRSSGKTGCAPLIVTDDSDAVEQFKHSSAELDVSVESPSGEIIYGGRGPLNRWYNTMSHRDLNGEPLNNLRGWDPPRRRDVGSHFEILPDGVYTIRAHLRPAKAGESLPACRLALLGNPRKFRLIPIP